MGQFKLPGSSPARTCGAAPERSIPSHCRRGMVLAPARRNQRRSPGAADRGRFGLGACAQLAKAIRSVYRWQGETCAEPEWRLAIKTTVGSYARLEAFIRPPPLRVAADRDAADQCRRAGLPAWVAEVPAEQNERTGQR